MRVLEHIDGVSFRSTGWMGRRFGWRTRTTTVLTSECRSAGVARVLIRWSVLLS